MLHVCPNSPNTQHDDQFSSRWFTGQSYTVSNSNLARDWVAVAVVDVVARLGAVLDGSVVAVAEVPVTSRR